MDEKLTYKIDSISISFFRCFLIVLVILGHCGCIYAGKWNVDLVYSESKYLKYITELIYSFHMPAFVFISGVLYYRSKVCLNRYNDYTKFIIKKVKGY